MCGLEYTGSGGDAFGGVAVMDVVRSQQADAAVVVFAVVPVEEGTAVRTGVLVRAEALGEVRPVLERLEMSLGKRVVVRDVRSRVALRDAEVGVQVGDHLRGHGRSAVSVDCELAGLNSLAAASLLDQLLRERGALAAGDHPAHDVSAEDVEDDV